jgi:hypothetical protein
VPENTPNDVLFGAAIQMIHKHRARNLRVVDPLGCSDPISDNVFNVQDRLYLRNARIRATPC